MDILIGILTVVEILVCLLLILTVLMQRPRQEGLGAAFGDSMASQMWGAQTTNVLQKFTVWLAVCLFFLTLILAVLTTRAQHAAKANDNLFPAPAEAPSKPAEPAAPAAATIPAAGVTAPAGAPISVTAQPGGTVTVKPAAPESKAAEAPKAGEPAKKADDAAKKADDSAKKAEAPKAAPAPAKAEQPKGEPAAKAAASPPTPTINLTAPAPAASTPPAPKPSAPPAPAPAAPKPEAK